MARWIDAAKAWARAVKRDVVAVWLAARDPRTPWAARILALCVAAYALSPIDLIPDFIPILGFLDDLLLVPLGILAVVRLMPPVLIAELRDEAATITDKPRSRAGLVAVIATWLLVGGLLAAWLWRRL